MPSAAGMTSGRIILFVCTFIGHILESHAANVQNPKFHVVLPSTTEKPTNPPKKDDCFVSEDEMIKNLKQGKQFNENPKYDPARKNCSGDYNDIEIKKTEISELEQWKTQVVIACTITAAVEIFIVVIIVLYWKQIRWSLRKLQCPCDESSRRQRAQRRERRRRHRAQQRRLRHLVVTTTQNAITATSQQTTQQSVTSDSYADTSQTNSQSDSVLHQNSHSSKINIKQYINSNKKRKLNSDRSKLESKPPDMQLTPMLKTVVDSTSTSTAAQSDKSLISEEIEPIPSTSYAGQCTRHFIPHPVLDSESESDIDYGEITTVQVHR